MQPKLKKECLKKLPIFLKKTALSRKKGTSLFFVSKSNFQEFKSL